ncbi:MAG: DUF1345 domain-containing protein [Xanthobacteraceae bacterium]|nr:DUF1345 domain-containing protein [Xanthobacteraceae bacterium]
MTGDDRFAERLLRHRTRPRPLRIVMARPRLFLSLLVGVVAFVLQPHVMRIATRLLVSWDLCVALYLALVYTTVVTGPEAIRRNAARMDDGRFGILVLTSVAAFATFAAIVTELGGGHRSYYSLVLAMGTIALSWAAIHTTFALHYAHDYYRSDPPGGLLFPSDSAPPDYWDFVYFSFVIGMTAQVSDVGVTDKIIRRTATAHGIASFVFNTALLALTINIVAGAL